MNFFTVVIENFRARTARTRVTHHPEVVGHVASALVVADANDTFSRDTHFLIPDIVGFIVFCVNGHPKLFSRQIKVLRQQFPSILNSVTLEVVSEAEVTQHFKERVVTGRVTDVIQVVVLTTGADALLRGRCARIGALIKTQKHIFKLVHTSIGEKQRGIVAGHHRTGMHNRMTFTFEELQKGLADLRSFHKNSL